MLVVSTDLGNHFSFSAFPLLMRKNDIYNVHFALH